MEKGKLDMHNINDLVEKWDLELCQNNNLATSSERSKFDEIFQKILILSQQKYEPFQPIQSPPEKKYMDRFKEWLFQFPEKYWKYLFYFSSKIIFYTHSQIMALIDYIYERKIKKIILDEIILKKKLEPFNFKDAEKHYKEELSKTLFVGLSDSSRINDFAHRIKETKRNINFGITLETLLYPTKCGLIFNEDESKKKICKDFEKNVLLSDDILLNKERLVILEDFSGSGTDIKDFFDLIEKSSLKFKKIIFAPYIITYKAKNNIDDWINLNVSRKKRFFILFGSILPKEMKCFDETGSYLNHDWFIKHENICEKIKIISDEMFDTKFKNDFEHRYGCGNVKICFAYYFNCPDNSLPIIWFNKNDSWKPLFARSSRIY